MTLIVGFNFGTVALVAADTRVSWYQNDSLLFRDDTTKIIRTSLGIASGAGLTNVLEPVKGRLTGSVSNTDDILQIIRHEVISYERRNARTERRVRDALDTTAWMFTYVTIEEGAPLLRLTLATTQPGARLLHVLTGTSWMFPPTGVTREQLDDWTQFLKERTKPLDEGKDAMEHLAEHAAIAGALVRRVSGVSAGVAPTFQLAIHALPYVIGLSGIIGEDGQHTWNWNGTVDESF